MIQQFVIPLNPQAWNVPPFYPGRSGGKLYVAAGRDEENHAFKEALREYLIQKGAVTMPGPYKVDFWLWHKIEQGRNATDTTNMQKLIEDALQDVIFEGDDSKVVDIHTRRVEQGNILNGCIVVRVSNIFFADFPPEELDNEIDRTLAAKPNKPTRDNSWP